jgi:hypothetical protein
VRAAGEPDVERPQMGLQAGILDRQHVAGLIALVEGACQKPGGVTKAIPVCQSKRIGLTICPFASISRPSSV